MAGIRTTRAWCWAPLALALAGGAVWAQDAEPRKAVAVADRNEDGEVDRREFGDRIVDVFFMLDVDKDGRLVPSELSGLTPAEFRRADTNGDGALQLEEFLEARSADFERADADGDGTLTASEIRAYDRAAAGR